MRSPLFPRARRTTPPPAPAPAPEDVREHAAQLVTAAVPAVEDLQVHALNDPSFRAGAEAMRQEVLRTLHEEFLSCECHPLFHALGTHEPVGRARPVTP